MVEKLKTSISPSLKEELFSNGLPRVWTPPTVSVVVRGCWWLVQFSVLSSPPSLLSHSLTGLQLSQGVSQHHETSAVLFAFVMMTNYTFLISAFFKNYSWFYSTENKDSSQGLSWFQKHTIEHTVQCIV